MSTFSIGDEVMLPQGRQAILRWVGRIPGRPPTEYAGVEVIGPEAAKLGKHSGSYGGQQYFQTEVPGAGLFVSYTQLVSANIRAPRLQPNNETSSVFGSPRSPRSPRRERVDSPTKKAISQDTRSFFRDALKAANAKVMELSIEFETQLKQAKAQHEAQLQQARRSSQMLASPGGSEVEEQRLALAAMQNKLIQERAERQEEIDSLKRELQQLRKVSGSVEDLETLVGDLAKYEEELTKLRSEVNEMDKLKDENRSLRSQNATLELRASSQGSYHSPNTSADTNAHSHANSNLQSANERLEKLLEDKLVREAELEAQNEHLQKEIAELKAAKMNEPPVSAEAADQSDFRDLPPQQINRVPVPHQLYDDSSMIDLAAGRTDWCSLCEREGHSAVDCPYE